MINIEIPELSDVVFSEIRIKYKTGKGSTFTQEATFQDYIIRNNSPFVGSVVGNPAAIEPAKSGLFEVLIKCIFKDVVAKNFLQKGLHRFSNIMPQSDRGYPTRIAHQVCLVSHCHHRLFTQVSETGYNCPSCGEYSIIKTIF
jgi:hypothetical protein